MCPEGPLGRPEPLGGLHGPSGGLLGAAAVPVILWLAMGGPPGALAAAAACLLGLPAARAVRRWAPGENLLRPLGQTGRLSILYSVAFSTGWIL